mgnify:CR=1 FL=1
MRKIENVIEGLMAFFAFLLLVGPIYSIVELFLNYIYGPIDGMGNLTGLITTSICGIIYAFWYRYMPFKEFNLFNPPTNKTYNLIILLLSGLGCQFFISSILYFIEPLIKNIMASYGNTVEGLIQGHPAVVIIYSVIVAPIAEELIFRGVIFNRLLKGRDLILANSLQAILFALYHWDIIQGAYAFTMGCLLGYVAYRYKSLFAAILLHMAINASAFLVILIPLEKGVGYYLITGTIGMVLISFFVYWLKGPDKKKV